MVSFGKIQRWNGQNLLNRQFAILGATIASRPLCFLLIPIIISALLSTGFFWMKINRDVDNLYIDTNGKAARNLKLVESLFPVNTSTYSDFIRMMTVIEDPVLYVTAKDGGSVLREDTLREMMEVHNFMTSFKVEWEGKFENFTSFCGKLYDKCFDNNLRAFMTSYQRTKQGKSKIKYPLEMDETTFTYIEYVTLLGGAEVDSEGYLQDAKAFRIPYFLDFSDTSKHGFISKWQSDVFVYLKNKSFKHLDVSILDKFAKGESAHELTVEILKIMPFVIGIILLFSALTCMSDEWVTSKPFLGLAAGVSAMLAIVSGLGLAFLLGIDYQDTYLAIMYVVLALEIDDAFILISSWRNTNREDTVKTRMEQTFCETIPSITVTSLTNILSCSIGIATSVPAFRMLSSVAVCCSFFAYVYQVTFFGACLAFSGDVEERSTRSMNRARTERPKKSIADCGKENKKGDIFMLYFRNTIGKWLTYPFVKFLVILVFLTNLSIAFWGWTHINYGTGLDEFFLPDSYVSKSVLTIYKYFDKYSNTIHVVMKEPLNYADAHVQESIEDLMEQLESHPHIADSSITISWLRYYKKFMQTPVARFSLSGYNMSEKQDFINGLYQIFLRVKIAGQFNLDLVSNKNCTDIVASRFIVVMKNINCLETEASTLKEISEIASKSELPVEIAGPTFHLIEQALIIKSMAIQIAAPAVCLTCLVFFVFSRNTRSSLYVSFIVLCIVCETVGYFSLWGVRIDFFSLITFILSIGFSINYPAHMAFAFVTDSSTESEERIKNSIYKVGFALTQGAFSSIFGLFILSLRNIYILTIIFKIISVIALLTTFHALFVIPVFLGLLGTGQTSTATKNANSSSIPAFCNRKYPIENDVDATLL